MVSLLRILHVRISGTLTQQYSGNSCIRESKFPACNEKKKVKKTKKRNIRRKVEINGINYRAIMHLIKSVLGFCATAVQSPEMYTATCRTNP